MFEFIKTIYVGLDAPLWAILGCPLGTILALHFASISKNQVQGARVDSIVREAKHSLGRDNSWMKKLGFYLALAYAFYCYLYILDRQIIFDFVDRLPI